MAFSSYSQDHFQVGDLITMGDLNRIRDNMIAIDEHNHGDGVGTVDLDCGQILFFSTIDGRLAFSIGSVNPNNPSGLNGLEVVSL